MGIKGTFVLLLVFKKDAFVLGLCGSVADLLAGIGNPTGGSKQSGAREGSQTVTKQQGGAPCKQEEDLRVSFVGTRGVSVLPTGEGCTGGCCLQRDELAGKGLGARAGI